jgi:hypothetical protein
MMEMKGQIEMPHRVDSAVGSNEKVRLRWRGRPAVLRCVAGVTLIAVWAVTGTWARAAASTGEEVPAKQWAEDAAAREVAIIDHAGSYIRYRQHKVDARRDDLRRDELREVVESKDGTVARLLMRDGRPLTAEEDQAERDRLTGLLDHPAEFQRHVRKEASGKEQAVSLIKLMPEAMIYSYAADQTPAACSHAPQVVLDYVPDPKFNAPTTESEALSGLRGRIWIDRNAKTIVRMTGEIFQPVNFGWGILAHVYPGGTVDLEQTDALEGRWNMTSFHEHVTVKALMVKTINVNSEVQSFDFQQLPEVMGYREAVKLLLGETLPK